jgi:hypothetical protein
MLGVTTLKCRQPWLHTWTMFRNLQIIHTSLEAASACIAAGVRFASGASTTSATGLPATKSSGAAMLGLLEALMAVGMSVWPPSCFSRTWCKGGDNQVRCSAALANQLPAAAGCSHRTASITRFAQFAPWLSLYHVVELLLSW